MLAINHVEPAKLDSVAAKELEQLSARVAATVVLPFDRHVHEGKEIGLDRLSKESRRSYLEMAAALADMFPGRAHRSRTLGRGACAARHAARPDRATRRARRCRLAVTIRIDAHECYCRRLI